MYALGIYKPNCISGQKRQQPRQNEQTPTRSSACARSEVVGGLGGLASQVEAPRLRRAWHHAQLNNEGLPSVAMACCCSQRGWRRHFQQRHAADGELQSMPGWARASNSRARLQHWRRFMMRKKSGPRVTVRQHGSMLLCRSLMHQKATAH